MNTVFYWTGVAVWFLGGLAATSAIVVFLIEKALKKSGIFMMIVLAMRQRTDEKLAIETGDARHLAYAIKTLQARVREGQKRRGVEPRAHEVEP